MHQGQGLHGLSVAVPQLAIQGGLSNEGSQALWNVPLIAKAAVAPAKNIAGGVVGAHHHSWLLGLRLE